MGKEMRKTTKRRTKQVMRNAIAHHPLTDASPQVVIASSCQLLPFSIPRDALCYGISFWAVWVSCLDSAPSSPPLLTGRAV